MERLYALHHVNGFMAGKPDAAVITSSIPEGNEMLPPAAQMGANAIHFYMMEEGMNFLGTAHVMGNVPCVKCGKGDECNMSGIKMMHGPDATVDSVTIEQVEKQDLSLEAIKDLGKKIAAALESK